MVRKTVLLICPYNFTPNFPVYISEKKDNSLIDYQYLVGGYIEPLPRDLLCWRADLPCDKFLSIILKRKSTMIYCNEERTYPRNKNFVLITDEQRIYPIYGNIIIEVREDVFANWYKKCDIFIPTLPNNFYKIYVDTQKKIALKRMGRNPIMDNYLMRKVFIKRLSLE